MKMSCISCSSTVRETFQWRKLFSFSFFQENLYPPLPEWLCSMCLQEIEIIIGNQCTLCSRPLANLEKQYIHHVQDAEVCYDCLRWLEWAAELGINRVLSNNQSVVMYNAWAQQIIYRYKFRGDERLKYLFTSLLIGLNLDRKVLGKVDLVSSIPLSNQRLRDRGFNQSALIARLFAEYYRIPYADNVLIRLTDDSEKQSKKNRNERLSDLLQKFIKNHEQTVDINNKHILLIDDIYTTGATLHAAAYTLLKAGAREVHSLTVAR